MSMAEERTGTEKQAAAKTDGGSQDRKDEDREKQFLYWLCKIPQLGAVSIRKLYEHFHSFETIFNIEERELVSLGIIKEYQSKQMNVWKAQFSLVQQEYLKLGEREIRFVTPFDQEYPEKLLNIYDYPMGLYVRGRLPDQERPSAAIVGARGCSAYGEQLAEKFAYTLSDNHVQVISGLALGIDGAAHRGAVRAGGSTFGVLGCGVNICYPPSHYTLYQDVIKSGGMVSEFPLGTPPNARNFPMRNRIISGLADVIFVVEAKEKSGSLITAELGLEQGKEVFALPGRITDALSKGCNQLIQQGAHMAISPNDILECLGLKYQKELILCEKNINRLAKKEKMVYSCLDFSPKHLDEIIDSCGLSVSECMGILLDLELGGYIFRSANHYYGKNCSS